MKKIILSFGIIAAVMASCSKSSIETIESSTKLEAISIQAGAPEITKTLISDESAGSVAWTTGDAISAFSANITPGGNNKLESKSISGGSASFEGLIEEKTNSAIFLYPYQAESSYKDGAITAVLPASQSATKASFANGVSLAFAKSAKTPGQSAVSGVTFSNLCAVLRFTLPESISFAKKITVSSKSATPMAGNVSINCENGAITSATASQVVLEGSFQGGNNYYITIAPGTYANGFTFLIETTSGATYTRETTKTVPAAAGTIYPLGTLSLAGLQAADFSSSVSIAHNVSSNTLNGSTARFTLNAKNSEFASAISELSATVTLKKGSTPYRTLEIKKAASIKDVEMNVSSSLAYLPAGDYSYTADIKYVSNGIERGPVSLSGTAKSATPSGFTIDAALSGYTSYNKYQSSDITGANNCDGSTIYGVGASYKSGLSAAVYSQCSSLLTVKSTLDGSEASGDKAGQSWAKHTVGAKWSFDGASGNCASTKDVQVTGLPYRVPDNKMANVSDDWSYSSSSHGVVDNNYVRVGFAIGDCEMTKQFNIPSSINVSTDYKIYAYSGTVKGTTTFKVGSTQIFSVTPSRWGNTKYQTTANATMNASNKTVSVYHSYGWGDTKSEVYWINLLYR